MEQLAAWMKHSGDSLFGTAAGPWPDACEFPITASGKRRYVHVPPSFREPALSVRMPGAPKSARLLRTGSTLPFAFGGGAARVELPLLWRTELVDVVEITKP